jgi:hypothetical protein
LVEDVVVCCHAVIDGGRLYRIQKKYTMTMTAKKCPDFSSVLAGQPRSRHQVIESSQQKSPSTPIFPPKLLWKVQISRQNIISASVSIRLLQKMIP